MPVQVDPQLLARVLGLVRRADSVAALAQHPFTRDQVTLIALAARDAQAWLIEPEARVDPDRLRSVESTVDVLARRLDEMEDLLRVHGHTANTTTPPTRVGAADGDVRAGA